MTDHSPTLSDPSQTPPSPGVEGVDPSVGERREESPQTFGNSSENSDREKYKYMGEDTLEVTRLYIEENNYPRLSGLAMKLRVHKNTITRWRKEEPEFNDLCEELLTKQEDYLMVNGMMRDKGQAFPMFLLKTNHGMIETQRHVFDTADVDSELDKLEDIIDEGEKEHEAARQAIQGEQQATQSESEPA